MWQRLAGPQIHFFLIKLKAHSISKNKSVPVRVERQGQTLATHRQFNVHWVPHARLPAHKRSPLLTRCRRSGEPSPRCPPRRPQMSPIPPGEQSDRRVSPWCFGIARSRQLRAAKIWLSGTKGYSQRPPCSTPRWRAAHVAAERQRSNGGVTGKNRTSAHWKVLTNGKTGRRETWWCFWSWAGSATWSKKTNRKKQVYYKGSQRQYPCGHFFKYGSK